MTLAAPNVRATLAASLLLAAALVGPVSAREARERDAASAPALPAYTQECGACHVPYPPGLLPAASWQRLMSNLPRHFGTDASLEPPMRAVLESWLQWHAGRSSRLRGDTTPPPDDRLTRAPWFQRKHREVNSTTWSRAEVRSPANCGACHSGAAQGDFDEHAVRLPR